MIVTRSIFLVALISPVVGLACGSPDASDADSTAGTSAATGDSASTTATSAEASGTSATSAETAGTSDTSGETAGTSDTSTETAGEGEFAEHLYECAAPVVCGVASYQDNGPGNPPTVPSDVILQCLIDAIDAREPALIVVSLGCEGSCAGDLYLVRSDGTALRQAYSEAYEAPLVVLPGGFVVGVASWADTGQICDLVDVGSCTPETCGSPSDWFLNCVPADTNACLG